MKMKECTQQTQADFILTSLCNDGTIWNKFGHQSNWIKVEDIPQDLRREPCPGPSPTT